jgi:hypothetical protein
VSLRVRVMTHAWRVSVKANGKLRSRGEGGSGFVDRA